MTSLCAFGRFRFPSLFLSAALASIGISCESASTQAPSRAVASLAPAADSTLVEDSDDVSSDFSLERRSLNFATRNGDPILPLLIGPFSNEQSAPVERFLGLARRTIDVEIYMMNDRAVRQALRAALARRVRVRVVQDPRPLTARPCDPWKSDGRKTLCRDAQALVREVIAAGGRYEKFNKATLCADGSCFQHGKMIVVDGELALVSTGNFNSTNLCTRAARPRTCNRDYTYVTRDPDVVRSLTAIFERDLEGRAHDPREVLRANRAEGKLTVSPHSMEPLAALMESARTSIQIQNQYIRPDSGLAPILIRKARAGVRVEIQLGDVCYYGRPAETPSLVQMRLMFAELEAAGAVVRMFPRTIRVGGRPGNLHAKSIVVDGVRAWIGSVNGSSQSLNENREFGVLFSNVSRVRALGEFMRRDFGLPENQTWQESFDCRRSGLPASATRPSSRARSNDAD